MAVRPREKAPVMASVDEDMTRSVRDTPYHRRQDRFFQHKPPNVPRETYSACDFMENLPGITMVPMGQYLSPVFLNGLRQARTYGEAKGDVRRSPSTCRSSSMFHVEHWYSWDTCAMFHVEHLTATERGSRRNLKVASDVFHVKHGMDSGLAKNQNLPRQN